MAQLVARYLGVVEAARSSRVTQTRRGRMILVIVLPLLVLMLQLERASDYRPAPQAQGGRVSKRKQSGGLFSRSDTPQRTRLKKRAGERHANGIRRGRGNARSSRTMKAPVFSPIFSTKLPEKPCYAMENGNFHFSKNDFKYCPALFEFSFSGNMSLTIEKRRILCYNI